GRAAARGLDHQRHRADEDLLAALDGDLLPGVDALAADERAVRAAAILDEEVAADLVEQRVTARDLRVLDDDVVVRRAAGRLDRLRREVDLAEDRLVLLRRGAARHRALVHRGLLRAGDRDVHLLVARDGLGAGAALGDGGALHDRRAARAVRDASGGRGSRGD